MQGLLLRLSSLDSDAESAVRVIAYFDSLVRDHATVPVMLRATARLAQCPVGILHAGERHGTRALPGGRIEEPVTKPPSAMSRSLGSDLGVVWMEREGAAHGLDEIVLERLAGAAAVAVERVGGPERVVNDPALVELALSSQAGEAERARALRLLGFDPGRPFRVLASPVEDCGDGDLTEALRRSGTRTRTAQVGSTVAFIVPAPGAADGDAPAVWNGAAGSRGGVGPRIGVGPCVTGSGLPESWAGARVALRFTAPGPRLADRVVSWDDLGALALFAAHVPAEEIAALPDVQALEAVARSPQGKETLEALDALCAAGSVRRAATAVHLHHSSMAARVARAEAALGFSLADPGGRFRAHLALRLHRLCGGPVAVSGAAPGAAPSPARPRPGG